jgi:hypothetical protein
MSWDNTAPTAKSLASQAFDNTAPKGVAPAKTITVRFASTENINLASYDLGDDGLDGGHTPNTGELLLFKDQTDPKENGIYVRGSTPIARAAAYNTEAELLGVQVVVLEGDENIGKAFKLLATAITLGTTELVFAEITNPDGFVDDAPTAITPA